MRFYGVAVQKSKHGIAKTEVAFESRKHFLFELSDADGIVFELFVQLGNLRHRTFNVAVPARGESER